MSDKMPHRACTVLPPGPASDPPRRPKITKTKSMKRFKSCLAAFALALPLAAQAQYFSQRQDVRDFIAELSARHDMDQAALERAFVDAEPLPRVIELIKPPAHPGIRSWKRYRSRFLDPVRISAGVSFWQEHEKTLQLAEQTYTVPAEIIVGIIGVETIYGRNMGSFPLLSALATLAFDYPPRAELFRGELEQLFLLAREQGQDVSAYRGSYAGALGLPQFLPSSVREFAVDGDGDGTVDLRDSAEDAIASVANYLARHGWQTGGRIVEPARALDPEQAQALVDAGIEPRIDARQLLQAQVWAAQPPADGERITLVDLITPGEPTQFWLGFQNFYVLTRYNRSSFYAMAVHDLGQAVKIEYAMRRDAKEAAASAQSAPGPSERP